MIVKANKKNIAEAARIIKAGGIVAFPTETVYGLGANALDGFAVQKIFKAKGRPADNPLIVHIGDMGNLNQISNIKYQKLEDVVGKLVQKFWPGPLTLVLPKNKRVPDEVTAGLETVAVRMPSHPVALALIKAAGVPIAAPSANLSGRPSPTTAQHVADDFGDEIFILDGGATKVGLESTVLDLTVNPPVILRRGAVTLEMIREVLPEAEGYESIKTRNQEIKKTRKQESKKSRNQENNKTIKHENNKTIKQESMDSPKAPGMKYAHYAPKAPLTLARGTGRQMVADILDFIKKHNKKIVGVLATREYAASYPASAKVLILGPRTRPDLCAKRLFTMLRKFDNLKVDIIISENFPEEGIGGAIMERLRKASGVRD